jgi:hypothetical protein
VGISLSIGSEKTLSLSGLYRSSLIRANQLTVRASCLDAPTGRSHWVNFVT